MAKASPFLEPGLRTTSNTLAIVSLARDNFEPITLQASSGEVDGYAEGAVLNTRFGSFPHSTLLDIPWGSQVRASRVDTGSRGRKRRRDATEEDTPTPSQDEREGPNAKSSLVKQAVTAASGFIYLLRPTPELWTSSLPHRTQVVYTPDYSYILHRIRARPGTRIIEAGAGSGSFTHASVRAVYNGYPQNDGKKKGKVFSFEFHEPRHQKMTEEIKEHQLDELVQMTHRDVYQDGFLIDGQSPEATAIFLDLPAPWEALHHLSRRKPQKDGETNGNGSDWVSPLDPKQTAHICTFSPCIEQVTRTVTELRTLGWTEVDMVEISQKRINVGRERVGVDQPNERGCNQSPANVMESVKKLKSDLTKTKEFHQTVQPKPKSESDGSKMDVDDADEEVKNGRESRHWLQGRIIHRPESDLKTHTSYLVFATLPREWTQEDEDAAATKWPCGNEGKTIGNIDKETRKQEKRELLSSKKGKRRKVENQEREAAAAVEE